MGNFLIYLSAFAVIFELLNNDYVVGRGRSNDWAIDWIAVEQVTSAYWNSLLFRIH